MPADKPSVTEAHTYTGRRAHERPCRLSTRAYDANPFTDILILVMRPPPQVINAKARCSIEGLPLAFFFLSLSAFLPFPVAWFRARRCRHLNMNQPDDRSMSSLERRIRGEISTKTIRSGRSVGNKVHGRKVEKLSSRRDTITVSRGFKLEQTASSRAPSRPFLYYTRLHLSVPGYRSLRGMIIPSRRKY